MAKCKYCGFDAPRLSDEDCPDKLLPDTADAAFNWKKHLGRAVVISAVCHWATHLVPVALALAVVMKGC